MFTIKVYNDANPSDSGIYSNNIIALTAVKEALQTMDAFEFTTFEIEELSQDEKSQLFLL